MKYIKNTIVLPLILILSTSAQFLAGHGKMNLFNVKSSDKSSCAITKRVANVLAPSNDDFIDYFVSDEKVHVHLPESIAKDGKIELTKKNIAKTLLVVRAFTQEVRHELGLNKQLPAATRSTMKQILLTAARNTAYDVAKDKVIEKLMDVTGSQVEIPHHVKKHKLFFLANYAASKAAGWALNIAVDAAYDQGKRYLLGRP